MGFLSCELVFQRWSCWLSVRLSGAHGYHCMHHAIFENVWGPLKVLRKIDSLQIIGAESRVFNRAWSPVGALLDTQMSLFRLW